jgi:GTP-binding protein
MAKKKPLISIIGRPNVGKSTLINRLAGTRVCIVNDQPGVTRDRRYVDVNWEGCGFTVADTGGLDFDEKTLFSKEILEQVTLSIGDSDALIFLVDARAGVNQLDAEVSKFLRKNFKVPVFLAANKVDTPDKEDLIYEFYELGFEKVYPVSAEHGSVGLADMLGDIKDKLEDLLVEEERVDGIRVSFVGKPNVGKSSLFNKLVGEDRSIVSDVSGTTRDSIDTKLNRHGEVFELVDTAGLRRKSKVDEEIERYSTMRAIKSIERSDVVLMLLDASEEQAVSEQDKKIVNLVTERAKGCIVLVNKWDTLEDKDEKKVITKFKEDVDRELGFISYVPKEYISAKTGQRTDKIWEMIKEVNAERNKKISTGVLNKAFDEIFMINPPPIVKQKGIKIKFVNQVGTRPPTFVFFTNYPDIVPESYRRFLERQIREYFGFEGTPIEIKFKLSV